MSDEEFLDWYQNQATTRDKELHDRLYDFGDLFDDMLFEGGCIQELIKCEIAVKKHEWIEQRIESPDELEYFSYNAYKTEIIDDTNNIAFFNCLDKVLCISAEHMNEDYILLHEMIHLHEDVLNCIPTFYRDSLLWALYSSLKKKVHNLDQLISAHAMVAGGQIVYSMGGTHDILFFLKSIDLDIRMGYSLGTVFGYDSANFFKGIELVK